MQLHYGVGIGQWTKVGRRIHGIAKFQRLHLLDEPLFKLRSDRLVHDEALGGYAGLPVVYSARLHSPGNRIVKIRAGHDHKWVAAAEFQYNLLDSF